MAVLLTGAAFAAPEGEPVLVLSGPAPFRLGLAVTVDGAAPAVAWEAFLDRLFAHFDRDGDGALTPAEAARIVPLPLPDGTKLVFAFARLDADGDGRVSRAELRAYCLAHGFGPLAVVVRPPAAEDLSLGAYLGRRLGGDGGAVTRAGLKRLAERLRSADLNEDGYLDRTELLAAAGEATPAAEAPAHWGPDAPPAAVLRLEIGRPGGVRVQPPAALRVVPAGEGVHHLHGPGGVWAATVRIERILPDVGTSGSFLLAQFQGALAGRTGLTLADLDQDPALGGLKGLFPLADRDGDGRLTPDELGAYFRLVEAGVRAQVWVTVTDRGRNPFDLLDADGDGRLSLPELARAADRLLGDAASLAEVPRQYGISVGGPAVASWGGMPLAAPARRKAPARAAGERPPAWFVAMDRNGDGVLAPDEFLGPPELFRQLDRDGDGLISAAEARQAEAARAGDRR
jgi:Ca2+-binding EF-hand superfamily protein